MNREFVNNDVETRTPKNIQPIMWLWRQKNECDNGIDEKWIWYIIWYLDIPRLPQIP